MDKYLKFFEEVKKKKKLGNMKAIVVPIEFFTLENFQKGSEG